MHRLKELRESNGMIQQQVADLLKVVRTTYVKYESGKINIGVEAAQELANFYGVTVDYLLGNSDTPTNFFAHPDLRPVKLKKFPMLGEIACGEPIMAVEDHNTYVEASAEIKADFCLTAKGDSMINAGIFNGDTVFVAKQPTVENGEIAVVVIEDSVTLKRFYREGDTVRLVAENPTVKTQIYTNEQLNQMYILGKAIALQRYLN